jgi:2-hydroxychromene-2-carboxylate isomerase
MTALRLDFWFEFASTYSYPAAMRISDLAEAAGVAVRFRPFLLGPIFKAQGWDTSPFNLFPAKGRHMWRDMERVCGGLNLPLRQPEPFPQNSILAARVALAGLEQASDEKSQGKSWGKDFCRAVYRAQFADGLRIDAPETIRTILQQLHVDADAVLASAQTDAIKSKLRAETTEAQELGVFGAPTFITPDGELFWGNDRLEAALAWANSDQGSSRTGNPARAI